MALVHDPATHCLGKLEAKPPRVRVAEFVDVEQALATVVPASVDNTQGGTIPLGMYLNDREGDCTCAAVGNVLRVMSRGAKVLGDFDIQTAYMAVTAREGAGYDPTTGANDNGCAELDVLDYWVQEGVGGDKLLAHAGVNMKDPNEHRAVCYLFGAVYLGVLLAVEQQNQDIWNYIRGSDPGSWGGHAVPELGYTPHGITIATWGAYKAATPAFVAEQADEGHALVTQDWLDANQGNQLIDVAGLERALTQLQPEL